MRKASLIFAAGLTTLSAVGQIKMADKAYKEGLSIGNSVTEPLSINNVFAEYDGTFLPNYHVHNILGDTLYTNGIYADCFIINHTAKTIEYQQYDYSTTEAIIPQGYYLVKNIVIGNEGQKEELEEILSLVKNGYNISAFQKEYGCQECKSQPNHWQIHLEEKINNAIWSRTPEEVNNTFTRYQSLNKTCTLNMLGGGGQHYWIESVDGSAVYFTGNMAFVAYKKNYGFIPLRYYNFLCSELKDHDILITYNYPWDGQVYCNPLPNWLSKPLYDALTGNAILQHDTLFHCVDIVIDDKLTPCCVLEGKNTGKISVPIYRLVESEEHKQRIFYSINPTENITIWHPYGQDVENRLLRNRYFATHDENKGRWIIKVDDLNDIIAETKLNTENTTEYEKLVTLRQQTQLAQRTQELCSKYGKEFGELIAEHKVALGMTQEMCQAAWGKPFKVSTIVEENTTYITWRYNQGTYVFFLDNKAVRIQN